MEQLLDSLGVKAEELEQPIEGASLIYLEKHCEEWERIGMYIELDEVDLNDIKMESQRRKDRRLYFLKTWRRKRGEEATYLKFIEALHSLEEVMAVQNVISDLRKNGIIQSGGCQVLHHNSV